VKRERSKDVENERDEGSKGAETERRREIERSGEQER
jgi:hypothetical protein